MLRLNLYLMILPEHAAAACGYPGALHKAMPPRLVDFFSHFTLVGLGLGLAFST